jgi:ribosome-associated heat shock protein Hsp15
MPQAGIIESGRRRAGVDVSEHAGDESSARLDIWLDVACLFKTRSEAQKAVRNGKISVNGQPAKAHRMLKTGDQLVIGRPFGRRQTVVVKAIADRHVSRVEARGLYDDLTPPPTPEEVEMRKLERMYRAAVTPPSAPDKRARRALRRLKEGTD